MDADQASYLWSVLGGESDENGLMVHNIPRLAKRFWGPLRHFNAIKSTSDFLDVSAIFALALPRLP